MAVNQPQFFKVILTPMEGFMIPKAYTISYGETLEDNTLLLKVPSGATWRVELVHKDGEAWVKNGWKDFAKYYSIQWGYFVLFTYEGSSRFFVRILDGTHSEIDYPTNRQPVHARENCRQQKWEPQHDVSFETSETEEDDHASVESETVDSDDNVSFETLDTEGDHDFSVETLESEDEISVDIMEAQPLQMRQGKRDDGKHENWSRNHLDDEDFGVGRGGAGKGKSKVTYSSSSEEEENWEERGRGWQSHIRKNQTSMHGKRSPNYETGESSRGWQSHIHKNKTSMHGKRSPNYETGESSSARKAFTCIIREAYITKRCIMHCPLDYARRHFPLTFGRSVKIAVVDPIGKSWEVTYAMRGHRAQWTGPGWRAMVRKNKLNVGDVCEFEQVEKKVFILRIIYRKTN